MFVDADLSLIKELVYFDGWSGYEDAFGALIFVGIDDSLQMVRYSYSCMSSDNRQFFEIHDVSEAEAIEEINDIQAAQDGID
jgi:hypothetical protein